MGSVDPCGDGGKTPIAFVGKEQWGEGALKLAAEAVSFNRKNRKRKNEFIGWYISRGLDIAS